MVYARGPREVRERSAKVREGAKVRVREGLREVRERSANVRERSASKGLATTGIATKVIAIKDRY